MEATITRGAPSAGELLHEWRLRRRRSQLDLAIAAGVSTRHLSFVETGRSRAVELHRAERFSGPPHPAPKRFFCAIWMRFPQVVIEDGGSGGGRARRAAA